MSILEALALRSPPWMKNAGCQHADPELFFPVSPGKGHPSGIASETALAVCEGCPVRAPCLDQAMANHERGIWGGTSEQDRARMQRQQARELNGELAAERERSRQRSGYYDRHPEEAA